VRGEPLSVRSDSSRDLLHHPMTDVLFHLTCVMKSQKDIRVQELSVWQI